MWHLRKRIAKSSLGPWTFLVTSSAMECRRYHNKQSISSDKDGTRQLRRKYIHSCEYVTYLIYLSQKFSLVTTPVDSKLNKDQPTLFTFLTVNENQSRAWKICWGAGYSPATPDYRSSYRPYSTMRQMSWHCTATWISRRTCTNHWVVVRKSEWWRRGPSKNALCLSVLRIVLFLRHYLVGSCLTFQANYAA